MLVIFDTCNMQVRPEPKGGVALVFTDIEGLPGTAVMVPVEGSETANALIDGMVENMPPGSRVKTFDVKDLKKEAQNHES